MEPPIIYCIENLTYRNPSRRPELSDQIYFYLTLNSRFGIAYMFEPLHHLLEACQKHDPGMYQYFLDLWTDMEEFYKSNTQLIRGLEEEEFDMERLVRVYYDSHDLGYLFLSRDGKPNIHTDPSIIMDDHLVQQGDDDDDDDLDIEDFFEVHLRQMALMRKVYATLKSVALRYLPALAWLERSLLRKFNKRLNSDALMMVDDVMTQWQRLIGYLPERELGEGEVDLTTLEGNRQFTLNARSRSYHLTEEPNPIFCVEIVEFEDAWISQGWNKVKVWYKLNCALGEMYHHVEFKSLIEEALVNYPAVYEEAMAHYRGSDAVRPRENQVLRGLLDDGHDLTVILASYLAENVRFMYQLRHELHLKSRPSSSYKNWYEETRDWWKEDGSEEHRAQFRNYNIMRDAMTTEALEVIYKELPELQLGGDLALCDYVEWRVDFSTIELQNDADEALDKAWEMRHHNFLAL